MFWYLSLSLVLFKSAVAYEDSEVIEAADFGSRGKRQFESGGIWGNYIPLSPCFNSKGDFGKCTSFRRCYPYFKLPDLNNWDSWVIGIYDTCSYFTPTGKQMFGVCCTQKPVQPPLRPPNFPPVEPALPEEEHEQAVGGAIKPAPTAPPIANWPPPIPTHPPDHTIPPLPTHPPSPGWPDLNPTTEPTEKPTKPPKPVKPTITPKPPKPPKPPVTPKPPANWPPPLPTHPPISSTRPPTTFKPVTTTTIKPVVVTSPPPFEQPDANDQTCGAKNGYQDQERIVGGQNADLEEWPWIAALFNGNRQFCGGSLIDNIHILTASHCVAHMTSWDVARVTVRLGDYNIKTTSETKHIEKKVKRVVRHKGFDGRTLYNDIAILTLDSPVTFSHKIRAICLPKGINKYEGLTATVIGWGSLREGGSQPSILQEVSIPIWKNSECKAKYGQAAPGGIVEHFLCAGRAAKDSCSGDSGGPLMVNDGGKWTQVGIVSWGIGCGKGQYPGVYTRVTHFNSWINKNLK